MEIILGYVLQGIGVAVGGAVLCVVKKGFDYVATKLNIEELRLSEEETKAIESKLSTEIHKVEEVIATKIKEGVSEKVLEMEKGALRDGLVNTAKLLDKSLGNEAAKSLIEGVVAKLPHIGAFKF